MRSQSLFDAVGLYPTQVGILSNQRGLSDAQLPCEPLPELLRKAGYQTAGFGKTHWSWKGCSTRGFEVRYASTDPEQGAVLMSDDDPEGFRRYSEETKSCGNGGENIVGYLGFTSKLAEKEHRDGWALARCLEFLDRGRDPKRPLFLYFSCLAPHAPHNVPPGFEELYDIRAMPVPEQPPEHLVEPCHATGTNREPMYRSFWSQATREQWQQMVLHYRATVPGLTAFSAAFCKTSAQRHSRQLPDRLCFRSWRNARRALLPLQQVLPLRTQCPRAADSGGHRGPQKKKGSIDHRPAEEVDILPTILQVAGIHDVQGKLGEDLLRLGSRKASFCEFNDQPKAISFMWRTADRKLILTFAKECLGNRVIRAGRHNGWRIL